jgi:hypothetical protein
MFALSSGYATAPKTHHLDAKERMEIAEKVTFACYQMWNKTTSKLAPETAIFNRNSVKPSSDIYRLRPGAFSPVLLLPSRDCRELLLYVEKNARSEVP